MRKKKSKLTVGKKGARYYKKKRASTTSAQTDMGDSSNKKLKMANHDGDVKRFDEVFHQLVTKLIDEDAKNPEISDAMVRFRQVLEYNCPGGKRNRGLSVITSYRFLVSSDQLTEENIHRAMVVGWCIEWLQAFFLVLDDIMDQSQTRRGQPCWYRVEEVGNMAINDACYIESCIYRLLGRFCRGQPYYVDLLELFQGTTYKTIVGQSLDLITSPDGKVNLSNFTEERYNAIVKYKTAFYSFHLPVAAAMYMAGITSKESHENAKTILLEMGRFFQIQDDYLDCYGDPAVTGKVGTDVEENKCSWLVVQALRLVDARQRTTLQVCLFVCLFVCLREGWDRRGGEQVQLAGGAGTTAGRRPATSYATGLFVCLFVCGKVGTGVEENKCSWLVVQALRLVDARQRATLQENYGQNDPAKVAAVKQLYQELRLQDEFWKFEESSYSQLMQLINSSSLDLPKDMFVEFARKIYKRQK
ncbi:farnesyl pyrophosphate synthase-like isoform X2 [Branchiostoma floridae]|uniref:Farnesyl pyrophosphate synthase n=1 Tax=Branchiostoma floridae TaxID=7739 RepID=A0A9J7KME2_BRAFL|nr:farnesyl pyrophosphate synthase-like isoform X2 [Branchiostoma floridae]